MRHGNGVASPNGRGSSPRFLLPLSLVLMAVLLLSVVSNATTIMMNASAQNSSHPPSTTTDGDDASSPSSSNSTNTDTGDGSLPYEQNGNSTSSSGAQSQESSTSNSNSTYYAGGGSNATQTSDEGNKVNVTTTSTITNSTVTENEYLPSDSVAGNLTETSGDSLVKISGEPLVQSAINSSITRSVTFPTLTFQGMADSEVTMTITWNTDGSTEVKDSRGYRYVLSVPQSEGAFSLWQNSTVVDQRVAGTEKQYDIFWRPVQNSGGYADKYEFFIAGTSENATTIQLAIDDGDIDGKNSVIRDNKLLVIHPMNQSEVGSSDAGLSHDLQNSTDIAFDNNSEYEPEGLELDWSDAVKSGYPVDFDAQTALLTVPVAGGREPFLIDPYVVGGTNTFISPEIGNYFEGQTRIVVTNNTRLNAFYYDSSNIIYRTSDDKGHTWSSAISLGTGTVASDKHRWTVVHYMKDGQEHVNVIYWHVVGSDTVFYSKAGTVTSPSASISWGSPVQIGSTTVNSGCVSASGSCVGAAAVADGNGTIYAAFKWVASGATYFSYGIKKSTDGGATWSDSLAEVTGVSIYRPALTLTSLDNGNMLFAYAKYDSADLYYRVFDGTSWSSVQTITGTGMSTNTYKQLSSAPADTSHQAAYIAYTNVTSAGGILKVARFSTDGAYEAVETADNTLRHNLPSVFSAPNGDLNVLSIANGKVYDTRKTAGAWEAPFNPFGTNFTSLDQLSGAVVMDGGLAGLWRESTGSPYNVRFGLLENGIVKDSTTAQNSPSSTDYYDGERRVFSSAGNVLFAFYYDGSQIRYKTSVDGGNIWSVDSVSTGTGQLASDGYRWTIVHYLYNATERVSLLYYNTSNSNSDTDFYSKTFEVSGTTLLLDSTVKLATAGNDPACRGTGACGATITGAADNNGTLFAAYSWNNGAGGSWYIWILKSSNGGQTWSFSTGFSSSPYNTGTIPITMTRLDSGKMLLASATNDYSILWYYVYNGSSWGGGHALSNIGWSSSSVKQISSGTVRDYTSNSMDANIAYVAYVTSGNSGTLKVATFYGNGTFKGIETADSTLSHKLPSISAAEGVVHIYSLAGGKVYDTRKVGGANWFAPTTPFGTTFNSPDMLTSAISKPAAMWTENATTPWTLRFGMNPFSNDPRLNSGGEQRVTHFDGAKRWLFYRDDSGNLFYKYTTDNGATWDGTSSASTGPLAANSYYGVYGQGNIVILTWANSTNILTKTGNITDSSIIWNSTVGVATVSGTNAGQQYYPSFEKIGSTLFLGFNVVSGGSNIGSVYSSANFGTSWSSSTSLYTGESNPSPVGIAAYSYNKGVVAVAKYGQTEFQYKTWNGTTWSASLSSTSGAGLTSNGLKTNAFSITSDDSCAWIGYVPSNAGGALKSIKFCDGPAITFPSTSVSGTNLFPTISSTIYAVNSATQPLAKDHIYMYYVRGNAIKEIETVLGAWSPEVQPSGMSFNSLAYLHADKYTSATFYRTGIALKGGTTSLYSVNLGTVNHGLVATSGIKNSPSLSDYFEGERRVSSNTNRTLFAFYYDGSNIMYRRSFDNGYTWTINAISTGSGAIASDNFRWSIAMTTFNGTTRIALIYYQVSGSNTNFYQKTFKALDTGLVLVNTVSTFSATNDASCSPTGVCAAAAGSSDQNSTLYAAYRWKSGGSWQYRILNSTDGGNSWKTSLSNTIVTTSNQFPITLTSLNNATMMLFSYVTYEAADLHYRAYNGHTWGTDTVATTGISTNSIKQISSDTVNRNFSNGTMTAYVVFLTNGNSGTIKVAKFSQAGNFLGLETADSSHSYSLPSISVAGDGVISVYSLANNVVYTTQRNGSGWQAPTSSYSITYSVPDELTSKISDSFTTGAMLMTGSGSPFDFLYTGLGWNTFWVAAYHDLTPHFQMKKAKITCNFSGTTSSIIDVDSKYNSLSCREVVTVFTTNTLIFHGEDWSYTASADLTADGKISVRGEAFEGCEISSGICNGLLLLGEKVIRFYTGSIPIAVNLTDNVTLYMEWDNSGTVTWYYQKNSEPRIPFGHFAKWGEEQPNFITGVHPLDIRFPPCPSPTNCNAYYFQAGVGSIVRIKHSGWNVTISGPAYANTTGGAYVNFERSKAIQGNDAYWDNTFREGGNEYSGVIGKYNCLNSAYPLGYIQFTYDGRKTIASGTKLWGAC